jgi:hypothetical protein
MKALLRSLLLWFLLAGVPLQGFASATMLLCGPAPVSVAMPAMMVAQVPHETAMGNAGGHDDHAAMLAAQSGQNAFHDGAPRQADMSHADPMHADHVKCASAGACCTGAPLAPSLPAAPPLQDGRHATVPFVAAAPAAVDLAGLERPPKFPTA